MKTLRIGNWGKFPVPRMTNVDGWKGWEGDPVQRPPPLNSRLESSLGDPGRQEVHTTVCKDKVSFPPIADTPFSQFLIEILGKLTLQLTVLQVSAGYHIERTSL